MEFVTLSKSGWLKRAVQIPNQNELISLTYSGRGIGTEKIIIDGEEIRSYSKFGWFVPEFSFNKNDVHYTIQVRVWPWLTIRTFEIKKGYEQIYLEGKEPYKVSWISEITQITMFLIGVASPFAFAALYT